jgi:protein farnesyltransferase/geranylgeranyltransferase type-1 subunit alpha
MILSRRCLQNWWIYYRLYRFKILTSLGKDLNDELAWVNKVSLEHLKNYQIWYARAEVQDI